MAQSRAIVAYIHEISGHITRCVSFLVNTGLAFCPREYEVEEAFAFTDCCHQMARLFSTILKGLGEEARAWLYTWTPGPDRPTRQQCFTWFYEAGVNQAFDSLTTLGVVLRDLGNLTPNLFWARVEADFQAHGLTLMEVTDSERRTTTSPEEVELALGMLNLVIEECETQQPPSSSAEVNDMVQRLSNCTI